VLFFDFGDGIDFLIAITPWARVDCHWETLHPSLQGMLSSRPNVAGVLKNSGHLLRWLSCQLAGKATGFPIRLEQEEPESCFAGEHVTPGKNRPAHIRVSHEQSDIDQVAVLIFELFNIRFFKERNDIRRQAWRGEVRKEDYLEKTFRLEHKAMIIAGRFLEGHCFTFRNASSDDSTYQDIVSWPSSYKKSVIQGGRYGYTEYVERTYDEKVLPHLQSGDVLTRERYTMVTEKSRWERKQRFLYSLDWTMSVMILCATGFLLGSCYPEANLLYPFILIFIGAGGKVVLHYYVEKHKKASEKPQRAA